jgi:hypothetical protein
MLWMTPAGLAKSESEQARAQQHEARRSQRQESAGDKITITHGTPAIPDAGPNYLKISESVFERDAASLARDQALDRKPSNAWAMKIPALNRPKNAVTVSIIANILCAPKANRTTCPAAQSKEFLAKPENLTRLMIWRNSRKLWARALPRNGTVRQSNQSFTTPSLSPFPPRSHCGIFIRCCGSGLHRGRRAAGCPDVGTQPVEW